MPRSKKKKCSMKSLPKIPTCGSLKPSEINLIGLEIDQMMQNARQSAKRHGINLLNGTGNADGNCAFESVLSNVNQRTCFTEKYPLSHGYYRRIWVTDMKNRTLDDETFRIYSDKEWEDGWNELMETGVYERGFFGDLMLFGIACGIKKTLLILNTNLNTPHDPIYVCDPRKFGVEPDTDIPVVLAYNLVHYENLIPLNDSDVAKTVNLVKQYMDGNYDFAKKDLPFLISPETMENRETNQNELLDLKNEQECALKYSIFHEKFKRKSSSELDMKGAKNLKDTEVNDMNQKEEKVKLRQERNKENMRKSRANKTNDEVNEATEKDKVRQMKTRSMKSDEDTNTIKEKDNARKKRVKENKSEKDLEEQNNKDKERMKKTRAMKSDEENNTMREKDNASKKRVKENKSEKDLKEQNNKDKERKKQAEGKKSAEELKVKKKAEKETKKKYRAEHLPISKYLARNAQMVLNAEQIVPELVATANNIGKMNIRCAHCKAFKWKDETPSTCCNNGKISLDDFPSRQKF